MNTLTNILLRAWVTALTILKIMSIRLLMMRKYNLLLEKKKRRIINDFTILDDDMEYIFLQFVRRFGRRISLETYLAVSRVKKDYEQRMSNLMW